MAKGRSEVAALGRELRGSAIALGSLVVLLWALEIVDQVALGGALDANGIRPRDVRALDGVLFAPFLHGGFAHVAANTVPLLVLGAFVLLKEARHFFVVLLVTTLVGGLGVWLFGRPGSVHLGASLWVFGLLGYLLAAGWFERSLGTVLLSLFVFLLYGGALWGVLPGEAGVSWESHLFGFGAGVLAARVLLAPRRPRRAGRARGGSRFAG